MENDSWVEWDCLRCKDVVKRRCRSRSRLTRCRDEPGRHGIHCEIENGDVKINRKPRTKSTCKGLSSITFRVPTCALKEPVVRSALRAVTAYNVNELVHNSYLTKYQKGPYLQVRGHACCLIAQRSVSRATLKKWCWRGLQATQMK